MPSPAIRATNSRAGSPAPPPTTSRRGGALSPVPNAARTGSPRRSWRRRWSARRARTRRPPRRRPKSRCSTDGSARCATRSARCAAKSKPTPTTSDPSSPNWRGRCTRAKRRAGDSRPGDGRRGRSAAGRRRRRAADAGRAGRTQLRSSSSDFGGRHSAARLNSDASITAVPIIVRAETRNGISTCALATGASHTSRSLLSAMNFVDGRSRRWPAIGT